MPFRREKNMEKKEGRKKKRWNEAAKGAEPIEPQ
jgi:hypothetical protein